VIRRVAGLGLKRIDLSRRIRLLGVKVSKLEKAGSEGPLAPDAQRGQPQG
jgi:DNA polymerase-4